MLDDLGGLHFDAKSDGLLGWYYEHRFREVFLSPWDDASGARSVTWKEISDLIEKSKSNRADQLPNFIMNTTLDLGNKTNEGEENGYNTIYEFTPQRFGSDGFGYFCLKGNREKNCTRHYDYDAVREELAPLDTIAATSGAAFDSSALEKKFPGAIPRLFISGFNFDLGRWYENPRGDKKGCFWKYVPLIHLAQPKWYRKDNNGCRMLLTDGGHSENLGAYSLIRRLPESIIIVDGEQDNDEKQPLIQNFTSYKLLRSMLLSDFNILLSIPGIEEEPQRNGPVFYGTASTIPFSDHGAQKQVSITVVYIKLPRPAAVDIACHEKLFAKSRRKTICAYAKRNPKFPQDPTFEDQSFDEGQFEAYRDLGLDIVLQNQQGILSHLGIWAQN